VLVVVVFTEGRCPIADVACSPLPKRTPAVSDMLSVVL
jgi:hypothetical protein